MTEQNTAVPWRDGTAERDNSADSIKYIWATIVEESPDSTNAIRVIGADNYIKENFNLDDIDSDQLDWLMKRLRSPEKLNKIDRFAVDMRENV